MSQITCVGETQYPTQWVVETLTPYLTPTRVARIEQVIEGRCRDVVAILENIYDRGNISAVMRSGEALGFNCFHIVDSIPQKFKAANRVTKGAEKWLEIARHSTAEECVADFHQRGFQVWTTSLTSDAIPIDEVPFDQKIAFFLGNEKDGVSESAKKICDGNFLLPMSGFSQSFNISVAGALTLFHAHQARKSKLGRVGNLSGPEKLDMKARYFLLTLDSADNILSHAWRAQQLSGQG